MADVAEKRELGVSLMFIGLALLVADLLVVFYLPAAAKTGRHSTLISIIAVFAVLGLSLIIGGYAVRGKAEPS